MMQFIMASTMETYGHRDPKDGPFTEDTPQNPMPGNFQKFCALRVFPDHAAWSPRKKVNLLLRPELHMVAGLMASSTFR